MEDGSRPIVKSHTIGYRYNDVSYVIVIPDAPYLEIVRGEQKMNKYRATTTRTV